MRTWWNYLVNIFSTDYKNFWHIMKPSKYYLRKIHLLETKALWCVTCLLHVEITSLLRNGHFWNVHCIPDFLLNARNAEITVPHVTSQIPSVEPLWETKLKIYICNSPSPGSGAWSPYPWDTETGFQIIREKNSNFAVEKPDKHDLNQGMKANTVRMSHRYHFSLTRG